MLDAKVIPKIQKLMPLLSSNHDGEVVAAVRAIIRSLQSSGSDIHDLTREICGGNHHSHSQHHADLARERRAREVAEIRFETADKLLKEANATINALRAELNCAAWGDGNGGCKWVDYDTPSETAAQCLGYGEILTDWEKNFCSDMTRRYGVLTEKQDAMLKKIRNKVKAFVMSGGGCQ